MNDPELFDWLAICAPNPPLWWIQENKHKYARAIESGKTELDRLAMFCDWRWTYASAMLARKQQRGDVVRDLKMRDLSGNEYVRRVVV